MTCPFSVESYLCFHSIEFSGRPATSRPVQHVIGQPAAALLQWMHGILALGSGQAVDLDIPQFLQHPLRPALPFAVLAVGSHQQVGVLDRRLDNRDVSLPDIVRFPSRRSRGYVARRGDRLTTYSQRYPQDSV